MPTSRVSRLFDSLRRSVSINAPLTSKGRDKLSGRSFAFVDSKGVGHLPLNDAGHVRNALARFNQTQFPSESAAKSAWGKILSAPKRYGIKHEGAMPSPKIRAAQSASSFAFAIEAQGRRRAGMDHAADFKGFDGRGPYRFGPARACGTGDRRDDRQAHDGGAAARFRSCDGLCRARRTAGTGCRMDQAGAGGQRRCPGRIWTPTGEDPVEAHEYRYVSPVFEYDDEGRVIRLLRAALTNNPNLSLPSISAADTAAWDGKARMSVNSDTAGGAERTRSGVPSGLGPGPRPRVRKPSS